MESTEDQKERLRGNAMVLALAQMIQGDDVVIDEARQSIGTLTSSEMAWLKEVERIAQQCETVRRDHSSLRPAARSEPGDIAIHKKIHGWHLRIVAGSGGNRVYLMTLSKKNERLAFASEHLAVARLTETVFG